MNTIKISDKYTIYRGKYSGEYSINDFLKYVNLNDKLSFHTNNNSVWVEIQTPVFDSINNEVKKQIEDITSKSFVDYAYHTWIYTQQKGFDLEWMHQHIQVHPPGRSNIFSDYTFTFYLQIPNNLVGDTGYIVFEDENKNKHKFLPKVGDIFIFPGELRHTAIPTPHSETKRIVYAGSFCIDIWNQKKINKNIL